VAWDVDGVVLSETTLRDRGSVLVQCCTLGGCPNLVCSAGEVPAWSFFGSIKKGRAVLAEGCFVAGKKCCSLRGL